MYIDSSVILNVAAIVTALSTIIGVIVAIIKFVERDRKQAAIINRMQDELKIIVFALRGALQGLIEQGCDGPCKDALEKLDKHINTNAHKPDM